MGNNATWPVYLLLACVLLLAIVDTGYVVSVAHKQVQVPTAAEIASKVVIPSAPVQNVSDLTNRIDQLQLSVNKDADWKTQAETLALSEAQKNGNRDIFRFLEDSVSVVEKQDIISVSVQDQKVTSFDADRQDATVEQELKVRYDGGDGQERVYLDVTTVIKDGEVDSQDFEFH